MTDVVRITVAPRREMVVVVTAGLEAMCCVRNTPREDVEQLRMAVEEVFLYALSTVKTTKLNADISVRFRVRDERMQVVIEYPGVRGPLDHYLHMDHLHLLQVKTFEALGRCIERKLLDSLAAHYWHEEGVNSYVLSLKAGDAQHGGAVNAPE